MLGRNCRFLQDGESNQAARDVLRRAIAAGRGCTAVLTNRRKDGSTFLNELHIAPVRNAAGGLIQYIGVLNDVTDRVRDAERLRSSEDLYRSVAATISDGLLVVDAGGAVVACNPPVCDALGVDSDRLVGHRLGQLGLALHDESDRPLAPHAHPVRRVLRGGTAVRDQPYRLHRPDGSVRTMLMSVQALNVREDGASLGCLVTLRDVTDQRAAEKALAEAEERWKFALEGAGDGVWDYDEDTRRTYFSPRWKQMLGYADDEIGHSMKEWADRVHPDDAERVQAEILRYRSGAIPCAAHHGALRPLAGGAGGDRLHHGRRARSRRRRRPRGTRHPRRSPAARAREPRPRVELAPGSDLYFSLVLRPALSLADLPPLTLAVGLAVADALALAVPHADVAIKWPNDVFVNGQKCAGILVETRSVGIEPAAVVVGIGINVNRMEFDPTLVAESTSLALALGQPVDREDLLADVLEQLERRVTAFVAHGAGVIVAGVEERLLYRGEPVVIDEQRGTLLGVDGDGALRVRVEGGATVRVISGRLRAG